MSIVAKRMNNSNVKTLKVPLSIFLAIFPIICPGTISYSLQFCQDEIPMHQQDKEYSWVEVKTALAYLPGSGCFFIKCWPTKGFHIGFFALVRTQGQSHTGNWKSPLQNHGLTLYFRALVHSE